MFSQILKFRTWDSLNGCFSDSLLIQYQCNVSNMANRWRTSRNTHQTVRAPQNKVLVSFLFFFLVQLVQYIHKNHSSNSNPRRKNTKNTSQINYSIFHTAIQGWFKIFRLHGATILDFKTSLSRTSKSLQAAEQMDDELIIPFFFSVAYYCQLSSMFIPTYWTQSFQNGVS